jgi:hypothetical protein
MALKCKDVLTPMEALAVWKDINEQKGLSAPDRRYVYRYAKRYEGRLSYRTANEKWLIYKDVWLHYLNNGFPDLELRMPQLYIAAALRYVKKFGMPDSYNLRELRRDLNDRDMVIKSKDPKVLDKVSRTSLNKFIAEWHGYR